MSAPILKNFQDKLTKKVKNRCKFWRSRRTPWTKPWFVRNPQWHPIGYLSNALRDYKKQYAQIEKETLSIVFGVECFHEYLYGCKFTIFNDHQPLKSILSRSIVMCPPRIQKIFLQLQKYDFELEYALGKTMLVSDALSWSYLNDIEHCHKTKQPTAIVWCPKQEQKCHD